MIKSSMQQPQAARKRIKSMKVAAAPRFALHWFLAEGDRTRAVTTCPAAPAKPNGAEAEAKAKASAGRLWRYLRHFHSIPFILPHLVAASLWKWKLPRNWKIPPHGAIRIVCVFFPFLFSLTVFIALLTLLHAAQLLIEQWRRAAAHNLELLTPMPKPLRLHSARSIYACLI